MDVACRLVLILLLGLALHLVVRQVIAVITRFHIQSITFRPPSFIHDLTQCSLFHLLSRVLDRNPRSPSNVLLPTPKFLHPSSCQFALLRFHLHLVYLRQHHLPQERLYPIRLLHILKHVGHFPTVHTPRPTLRYHGCHRHVHHPNLF